MNFFLADVQTGFGTFVAFYLARLGWTERSVGIALTVGGLAGVLSQIPGGALADAVPWKRGLIAIGIVMIGAAALILALAPNYFAGAVRLRCCRARPAASSRRRSAPSASVWSAGAACRCAPGATTAMPPAATP